MWQVFVLLALVSVVPCCGPSVLPSSDLSDVSVDGESVEDAASMVPVDATAAMPDATADFTAVVPVDMTARVDMTPPPCGDVGQLCCVPGFTCKSVALYCFGQTCVPVGCGTRGRPCCAINGVRPCLDAGDVCFNGACSPCGAHGYPCCDKATCGDGVSACNAMVNGLCLNPQKQCGVAYFGCIACGLPGTLCCRAMEGPSPCRQQDNTTCTNGSCILPCGGSGQPCCLNGMCAVGKVCQMGKCFP